MTLAAPDWSQVERDVICPLCEYNLRGLSDNRCPECGYVFEWEEVLHPEIVRHPYLFEHNPRRNARSFFATLLGGLRPYRFWSSLRATHRPVLGRLLLYALLCAATLLVLPGFMFLRKVYDLNQSYQMQRAAETRWFANPMGQQYRDATLKIWKTTDAYLDFKYPPLFSGLFVSRAWREMLSPAWGGGMLAGTMIAAIPASIAVVLWPWLTFLTLMIFLASMRRANVRPVHVLRCAIYSSDAIWLVPILIALMPVDVPVIYGYIWAIGVPYLSLIGVAAVYGIVVAHRLARAYGLYLRFPHALAVAVSSQLIIVMAIVIVALNAPRYW